MFCIDMYNSLMGNPTPPVKRSPGRPRAFDRDKALCIARDLFWRHGFEGTSTTQLTEAMGISQPSLYGTFGSKEALYREAVGLYLARFSLEGFLGRPGMADLPARKAIEAALFDAAERFGDSNAPAPGCMVALAGLQGGAAHQSVFKEMVNIRVQSQLALRARLLVACKRGELPAKTDIDTLASYFAMIIQGMAIQAHDGSDSRELKRLAKLAMTAWPPA